MAGSLLDSVELVVGVPAGNLTLEPVDLAEIAGAIEETQAGGGPSHPVVSVDDHRGTWLEHGLDPSSLEGALARMTLSRR